VIPFDRIKKINYSYDNTLAMFTANRNIFWDRTDQVDMFTIALDLINPTEKVTLFNFLGEGKVMTGWSGVALGDSKLDFGGAQAESSRGFVEILKEYTGKTLT